MARDSFDTTVNAAEAEAASFGNGAMAAEIEKYQAKLGSLAN